MSTMPSVRCHSCHVRLQAVLHSFGVCGVLAFPSTTAVSVGQVRLYSILMEDVRELKEFVVKHCRVVCFSGGGQYFSFAHNAQVGSRPT